MKKAKYDICQICGRPIFIPGLEAYKYQKCGWVNYQDVEKILRKKKNE